VRSDSVARIARRVCSPANTPKTAAQHRISQLLRAIAPEPPLACLLESVVWSGGLVRWPDQLAIKVGTVMVRRM
jgi:hypothetical protein